MPFYLTHILTFYPAFFLIHTYKSIYLFVCLFFLFIHLTTTPLSVYLLIRLKFTNICCQVFSHSLLHSTWKHSILFGILFDIWWWNHTWFGSPIAGWFIREIPLKWMMTGGTPISGNHHIFRHSIWHYFWHSIWHILWHSIWYSFGGDPPWHHRCQY